LLDYVTDFSGAVNCRSARLRRKFADAEGGADAISSWLLAARGGDP